MKNNLLIAIFALAAMFGCRQGATDKIVTLGADESVWAGVINDGHLMPLTDGYKMDFYGNNKVNQTNPVILTSKGQFVWSEEPFAFEIKGNTIVISDSLGLVQTGKQGETLAEVYRFVAGKYFPASGKMPDTLLFAAPQYNTWIELNYNHNQADILKYAQAIIDNGLPPGVFMIDDTWQEDYGIWDFHPKRFPNPKAMIDQLHQMGFKVMLWVCPFVSADQKMLYFELKDKKAFILEKETADATWETSDKPYMTEWWNGVSANLDYSNPEAVKWFNAQLDRLVADYNIDGFKFDAADSRFYPENSLSMGNVSPNKQAEYYAQLGLRFPLNEYRACWKMAGQPLAQRLHDKAHSWEDLQKLIPLMVAEGISGYTFSCPDMIGGGLLETFTNDSLIDQDLVVRSAQCHALMPMMQFSVAPWRILDKTHMDAVKEAVKLRMKFTPLIVRLAAESAKTGEPILKNMEFVFPNQGFAKVVDQFMLGDSVLVAPVVEKGKAGRTVVLPAGKWTDDRGQEFEGGTTINVETPLNSLPWFQRKK
jgi:alpha-glucosidase